MGVKIGYGCSHAGSEREGKIGQWVTVKRDKDQEDQVTSSRTLRLLALVRLVASHWLLGTFDLILSLIRDYLIYLTTTKKRLISPSFTNSFFDELGLTTTQGLREHAKLLAGESRLLSSEG